MSFSNSITVCWKVSSSVNLMLWASLIIANGVCSDCSPISNTAAAANESIIFTLEAMISSPFLSKYFIKGPSAKNPIENPITPNLKGMVWLSVIITANFFSENFF